MIDLSINSCCCQAASITGVAPQLRMSPSVSSGLLRRGISWRVSVCCFSAGRSWGTIWGGTRSFLWRSLDWPSQSLVRPFSSRWPWSLILIAGFACLSPSWGRSGNWDGFVSVWVTLRISSSRLRILSACRHREPRLPSSAAICSRFWYRRDAGSAFPAASHTFLWSSRFSSEHPRSCLDIPLWSSRFVRICLPGFPPFV